MAYHGKCYCGNIEWQVVGKVDFTSACHCTDCQAVSGSAFGTTSLMIYNPKGVLFKGGSPKVIHGRADSGNTTQRGFCSECGSVLFNHVSEGQPDEHWAIRTGGIVGQAPPKAQKEIFMQSKPTWIEGVQTPENQYERMPH